MSWEAKKDYCGLGDGTVLVLKTSNENASSSYLEKLGQNGNIVATKLYGDKNAQPTCEYVIKSAGNVSVQIGKVTTVDSKRYALQSVVFGTTAGGEPTVSATAVRIEDSTDGVDKMFEAVTVAVSPEETAQVHLSAATLSESTGCEITAATTTISGTVSPHTVNGDPVSSGVHSGKIEVELTVGQYNATAPTFAAGTGFELSQAPSCNDPDSELPEWTAKVTKPLAFASASSSPNP